MPKATTSTHAVCRTSFGGTRETAVKSLFQPSLQARLEWEFSATRLGITNPRKRLDRKKKYHLVHPNHATAAWILLGLGVHFGSDAS
jgi:hypothetical protein